MVRSIFPKMFDLRSIAIPGFILLSVLLVSCSDLSGTPVPTLYPTEHIPTVIAMTLEAQGIELNQEGQPAASPTVLPSPTPTQQLTLTSSPSPTQSQTPPIPETTPILPANDQDPIPTGDIPTSINQILSPGPDSKVISPFTMRAAIKPGDNSVVRIELFGQDGQLLMREVRTYQSLEIPWLSLGSEISFGINSIAEPGRLQVSIEDEHGRLKSVSSTDLVLQSIGNQDLNQPIDELEDIVLESPRANFLIQGGTMRVAGMARPRSTWLLRIEIVTSDGKIVGTRQVSVNPPDGNQYGYFAIDVPYNITSTNRVRVQVWEPGSRIPGVINLSSVEVLLSP
jgi:hypothetical protein